MKFLLFIFIFLQSVSSFAQTSIKWSQEFKDETNEQPSNLLYDDGQYLYIEKDIYKPGGAFTSVSDKVSKISIMKFDYQLNLVKSADFTIDLKKDENLLQVKHFGNYIVLFTMKHDYDKSISEIWAEKINMETLTSDGARSPIVHLEGGSLYEDKTDDSQYYVAAMRNGKSKPVKFIVLDKELKPFAQHEVSLTDSFDYLSDWTHCVTSNGTIFLGVKEIYKTEISEKLKKSAKGEQYFTNVSSVPYIYIIPSSGKIQKHALVSNDEWITQESLHMNKDGSVIFSCIYKLNDPKKKPFAVPIDGGFLVKKFDAEGNQLLNISTHFSNNLINDIKDYHGKENDNSLPFVYSIQNIIDKGDKLILFLTDDELNFYQTRSSSSFTSSGFNSGTDTYTTTDRTSNESVILSINADGTENWHRLIPKKQLISSEKNYDYSSQMFIQTGDKCLVIYNDLEANIDLPNPKEKDLKNFNGKKDAVVVISEINEKGELKKAKWNDPSIHGETTFIARSKQTRDKIFIYYYDDSRKVKKFGLANL